MATINAQHGLRATLKKLLCAARASFVAPGIERSLAKVGLQRTLESIERSTRCDSSVLSDCNSLHSTERMVSRVFRFHPLLHGQCLERALVQYALHRRQGEQARLVVGVRRSENNGIDAHAWIDAGPAATEGDDATTSTAYPTSSGHYSTMLTAGGSP